MRDIKHARVASTPIHAATPTESAPVRRMRCRAKHHIYVAERHATICLVYTTLLYYARLFYAAAPLFAYIVVCEECVVHFNRQRCVIIIASRLSLVRQTHHHINNARDTAELP